MHAKTRSLLIGLGACAGLLASPACFAAGAPVLARDGTLSQGDRGLPVRVLQADLSQLGDFGGVVSGDFGPGTAAALRSFQTHRGLTVTGTLDPATSRVLVETASSFGGGGGGTTARFVQGTNRPVISGGLRVGGTIDGLRIERVLHLTATAYGATAQDNYPYGATDAFGLPLRPGDVAVDPSVIPLNTKLYVTGYKTPHLPAGGELAVARDTGGAIKGKRIDMYINSHNESLISSFGIQHVTAYVLGK